MNTEVKSEAIGTKAHLLDIMERGKKYADEHHERTEDGKPNVIWQLEVNAFAEGAISERLLMPAELKRKITEALERFVQKGSMPWLKEKQDEVVRLTAENAKLRGLLQEVASEGLPPSRCELGDRIDAALAAGLGGGQ